MELSEKSSDGKNILYRESIWTGKKKLLIDGKEALKVGKKVFRTESENETVEYVIKGNFLCGVSVSVSTGETIVLAKNAWYDWLMIFLPFVGIVFGVGFCGALGGGLSALFCILGGVFNATISRTRILFPFKILSQIGIAILANGIWFAIYYPIALFVLSLI